MSRLMHIGIVGGSAEGAALCYRTICSDGARSLGGYTHPEVSMHTPSFEEYVVCLRHDDWDGVAKLMLTSANKLAAIGAEFLICPDNTFHRAFPGVVHHSSLPWIHIADVVVDRAVGRGLKRVGILGTRWLVDGDVYPEKLAARNLEYLRPTITERVEIERIILEELVYGDFKQRSTDYILNVIQRMKMANCDSVVLGCTELPLIINDSNSTLRTLNSTRLLAWAALQRASAGAFQMPDDLP
jgi:aspartate racemase